MLCVLFHKIIALPKGMKIIPWDFSQKFRSMTHFKLIFAYGMK